MESLLTHGLDLFLHLDHYLNEWTALAGPWIYLILFLVIFCETGLVVTPFLPGDSLLFALGALAATEDAQLSLYGLLLCLIPAAILGDTVNYAIGHYVGPKVFSRKTGRWLNQRHLLKTQAFYERHGGKAVFLARFVPMIRTFAPFVAGIGAMRYDRFIGFNISGGIVWITLFLLLGYFFGNLPFAKKNFEYIILGIIFVSLLPLLLEWVRGWKANRPKNGL